MDAGSEPTDLSLAVPLCSIVKRVCCEGEANAEAKASCIGIEGGWMRSLTEGREGGRGCWEGVEP
jgi:hypothetical protein